MEKFRQLIFIDDDEPTNVYHNIIVEESGLCDDVKFFDNGLAAIEYFKEASTRADFILPDMVFLDINMPVMNGWDFIEAYKNLDLANPLFIVLLTTSLNAHDKAKAAKVDLIHKFISKPLQVEILKNLKEECFVNS